MRVVQEGSRNVYARVITTRYQPGKMEEGLQIYHEVLSETTQQSGFKGVLGLVDRKTDKVMSISLWESEDEAQASGTSTAYFQEQFIKLASVLAAAPGIETYEVVLYQS